MKKNDIGAKALLYPIPVLVVATYDKDGKPNAMTAGWGGVCCSNPPCVAVSLRKATHTYGNLLESKAFTINIPSEEQVMLADYLGIASGKKEDKLAKAGLTPIRSDFVNAPYLDEFAVNIECEIVNVLELGLHTQFVGEVKNIKIDSSFDEKTIMEQLRPLVYAPDSRLYYGIGKYLGKAFSIGKEL